MDHPTLMDQLLKLESKIIAILDMEDVGYYTFNLKQAKEQYVNYNYTQG